ncbi:hypothetical protein S40288_11417 [Stachybotrys chartarum IBT 40288]|nr:hypothetical protein S40288_11417 [Stachybotrys chartarum IBT 40288]
MIAAPRKDTFAHTTIISSSKALRRTDGRLMRAAALDGPKIRPVTFSAYVWQDIASKRLSPPLTTPVTGGQIVIIARYALWANGWRYTAIQVGVDQEEIDETQTLRFPLPTA